MSTPLTVDNSTKTNPLVSHGVMLIYDILQLEPLFFRSRIIHAHISLLLVAVHIALRIKINHVCFSNPNYKIGKASCQSLFPQNQWLRFFYSTEISKPRELAAKRFLGWEPKQAAKL